VGEGAVHADSVFLDPSHIQRIIGLSTEQVPLVGVSLGHQQNELTVHTTSQNHVMVVRKFVLDLVDESPDVPDGLVDDGFMTMDTEIRSESADGR
jgi:hypothetical protein